MNLLDTILKPFKSKLEDLEKEYETLSKYKLQTVDVYELKLKQLLFKNTKPIPENPKYDYGELSKKNPEKNNVLAIFDKKNNEHFLNSTDFHKKIILYRMQEIRKILLIMQQLVIIFIYSTVQVENPTLNHDIKGKYKLMKDEKKRIIENITQPENLEKFRKNYCKYIFFEKHYNDFNEKK